MPRRPPTSWWSPQRTRDRGAAGRLRPGPSGALTTRRARHAVPAFLYAVAARLGTPLLALSLQGTLCGHSGPWRCAPSRGGQKEPARGAMTCVRRSSPSGHERPAAPGLDYEPRRRPGRGTRIAREIHDGVGHLRLCCRSRPHRDEPGAACRPHYPGRAGLDEFSTECPSTPCLDEELATSSIILSPRCGIESVSVDCLTDVEPCWRWRAASSPRARGLTVARHAGLAGPSCVRRLLLAGDGRQRRIASAEGEPAVDGPWREARQFALHDGAGRRPGPGALAATVHGSPRSLRTTRHT